MFENYYMKGFLQLGQMVGLIVLGLLITAGAFSSRVRATPRRMLRVMVFLFLASPLLVVDWWINQGVGSAYPTNVAIGVHYSLLSVCAFISVLYAWLSFRAARRSDPAIV